jgi:hypothetical protein
MASRPVCLGIKHPSGAYDQIFITIRQLQVCWCGALSLTRTGLSFTISACPRQRSHSRVGVPWGSQPYFTVSDSILPFSSPPTTRRATVEVFDAVFTRDTGCTLDLSWLNWVCLGIKHPFWGLWPDFYYFQTAACLLMWGALSDERTGMSYNCCWPRQRSYSRVRGGHIFLSQIRDFPFHPAYNPSARTAYKTPLLSFSSIVDAGKCLLGSRYSETSPVYLLIPRSLPSGGRCL